MDTGLQVIFKLPPLPYAHDALEPHMSAATLGEHHGEHQPAHASPPIEWNVEMRRSVGTGL